MMYNVSFPGMGLNFTIDPVLLSFGDFKIYWYGFLIAFGFALALFYVMKRAKDYQINQDKLLNIILIGLIFGIIGARLYYVVFYPGDMYIKDPMKIFNIHEGGLGIYGGIIFALLSGVICAKIQKIKILPVLDLAGLGFLIGQSIGRWGNFINQEAFGSPTDLPWGMLSENTLGQTVHPCFLYESIWCALGFVILHFYSKKFQKSYGEVFCLYMIWYGAERFFVEALRTDSLYLVGTNIKISQLVAILAIIGGIILFTIIKKRGVTYVKDN